MRIRFGNWLPSTLILCALLGLCAAAAGSTNAVAQDSSQVGSGRTGGPVIHSLQALFPHARGVFLAEVDSIEHTRDHDFGSSDYVRLRVISRTGLATNGLRWRGLGNVKYGGLVWLEYYHAGLERKLRITPHEFSVGRRYWFITADSSERNFYPQGIMQYWAADSAGVPPAVARAVQTDAYRLRPR